MAHFLLCCMYVLFKSNQAQHNAAHYHLFQRSSVPLMPLLPGWFLPCYTTWSFQSWWLFLTHLFSFACYLCNCYSPSLQLLFLSYAFFYLQPLLSGKGIVIYKPCQSIRIHFHSIIGYKNVNTSNILYSSFCY